MAADTVFNRFEIDFDAGDAVVFHGGELITGNLRIELKRPMTINVIKLQLKGRAAFLNDSGKNAEIEKVSVEMPEVIHMSFRSISIAISPCLNDLPADPNRAIFPGLPISSIRCPLNVHCRRAVLPVTKARRRLSDTTPERPSSKRAATIW